MYGLTTCVNGFLLLYSDIFSLCNYKTKSNIIDAFT